MEKMDLNPIINLLKEQVDLQNQILKLSYDKRQAIAKGNVEKLNEIVEQELKYLSKLNKLEKSRIIVLEELCRCFEISMADITISYIIEKADGEDKAALSELKDELTRLMAAQKDLNKANQELLETQINYTDAMLNIAVGQEDPLNHFYNNSGSAKESERRQFPGLFDQQI